MPYRPDRLPRRGRIAGSAALDRALSEWDVLSRGLTQRVMALNAFLYDVYHDRDILRAGHVPEKLILHNELFRAEMQGLDPPQRVYTHVTGIDIVRTDAHDFYVLEDNCRTP